MTGAKFSSSDCLLNVLPSQTIVKKRRQHHVWQRYLAAWTGETGQLYCLMDDRIFPTGTAAVAVEQFFYKIGKLTDADVALIRFLMIDVKDLHPLMRKSHEEFLKLVSAPDLFESISSDTEDLIDTFRTNALEDYHAKIESAFLPLLQSALKKDISFYSNSDSCITLFRYMATQHMRTKGIRVKTIDILRKKSGLDASRIWSILSQMLASNIGMSMYFERGRRRLVLIENDTERAFITGDQPIINLYGDGENAPTTLCWYYPISPRLALLLTEVDEEPAFTTASLTSAQVDSLNAKMVATSHRQVFAHSPTVLMPYAAKANS